MDKDFADFLIDEMKKRGWSQADLAKASGQNRQLISTYVNRQRKKPEPEVLTSIAKGLKLPVEVVMRAAGILPPVSETIEKKEQLLFLFNSLSEKDQQTILDMMNFLLSK